MIAIPFAKIRGPLIHFLLWFIVTMIILIVVDDMFFEMAIIGIGVVLFVDYIALGGRLWFKKGAFGFLGYILAVLLNIYII